MEKKSYGVGVTVANFVLHDCCQCSMSYHETATFGKTCIVVHPGVAHCTALQVHSQQQ